MKKKIGIFTTFYDFDRGYSLCSVVYDQLVAHVKRGYTPVLFVLESFKEEALKDIPEGVEVRKVVPQVILEPYRGLNVPDTWKEDVARVVKALEEHASDIEIMLAHDIVFIDTYLPYNLAFRQAQITCKFLHWIHSAPSPRPVLEDNLHANRYTLPPRSKLVYLNNDKTIHLAEMYGTYATNVRVVSNSRDPRTFWGLDPLVEDIIDRYDVFSADIISVYPLSTTRMMDGKQLGVAIEIHKQLQKLGYKTRLIVPNAHANGKKEKELCRKLVADNPGWLVFTSLQGGQWGLVDKETYEVKEMHDAYENGVSSKVVSDLFRLSNVFIFPSISENCSLVLLEAMLAGNLLVLNKDCSGLQEFGAGNAIYFKMGNLDMGTRNEENALKNEVYFRDMALIIKSEFEVSKPLQAKRRALQEFNYDRVFDKIETLYYEQ